MFLNIIIIAIVLLILALVIYIGPVKSWTAIMGASEHIQNETAFYCKARPEITCRITEINLIGYSKPKATLEVTYPDKSVCEIITTLGEFNNLWAPIENV